MTARLVTLPRMFRLSPPREGLGVGLAMVIAGLIGGAAEVLWVILYASFTSFDAVVVAREIGHSVFPYAAAATVMNGLVIHFALSLLLAAAFALIVWRPLLRDVGWVANVSVACVALALIWTINFGLVLPFVNPAFVDMLPYSVTFISKILFGASMGWALHRLGGRSRRAAFKS